MSCRASSCRRVADHSSCVGGAACARALRLTSDPRHGYLGRTIIAVNGGEWDRLFYDDILKNIDMGSATSHERVRRDRTRIALLVHELGHALGFSHPYERMFYRIEGAQHQVLGCPASFTVDGNAVGPIAGYTPPRLGFHYEEAGSARKEIVLLSESDSATLLAVDESVHGGTVMIGTGAHCWGDTKVTAANRKTWTHYEPTTSVTTTYGETPGDWRYDRHVALAQYTKDVYARVYNPAEPTDLTVMDQGDKLGFRWEADHVHVERGFAVHRGVLRGKSPYHCTNMGLTARLSQRRFGVPALPRGMKYARSSGGSAKRSEKSSQSSFVASGQVRQAILRTTCEEADAQALHGAGGAATPSRTPWGECLMLA